MAKHWEEWMLLGNEFHRQGDSRSANECWIMAAELREKSEADEIVYNLRMKASEKKRDF